MPKTPRKKKITLVWEEDYFDYDVFGIVSHYPDYRLVYNLNAKVDWHFERSEEEFTPAPPKGKAPVSFPRFDSYSEDERFSRHLVKNKIDNRLMIEERPAIDYFLFLKDAEINDFDELKRTLNEADGVLGVYHFDPEELPSTKNIVL